MSRSTSAMGSWLRRWKRAGATNDALQVPTCASHFGGRIAATNTPPAPNRVTQRSVPESSEDPTVQRPRLAKKITVHPRHYVVAGPGCPRTAPLQNLERCARCQVAKTERAARRPMAALGDPVRSAELAVPCPPSVPWLAGAPTVVLQLQSSTSWTLFTAVRALNGALFDAQRRICGRANRARVVERSVVPAACCPRARNPFDGSCNRWWNTLRCRVNCAGKGRSPRQPRLAGRRVVRSTSQEIREGYDKICHIRVAGIVAL